MRDLTDINLTRSLAVRDRLEVSALAMLAVGLWEAVWVKIGLPMGLPDPIEFGVWLTSWAALWAHGHLLADIRRNMMSLILFMYLADVVRMLVPVFLIAYLSPLIRGVGP